MSETSRNGTIHNLIDALKQALEQLDVDISDRDLEYLAVEIHKIYSVEARNFHSLEHVLSLVEPNAPICALAAIFHDLVYYQVDQVFLAPLAAIITPYLVNSEESSMSVSAMVERPFEILKELFDISPGQPISSTTGINEFFSALVAWKKLDPILPELLLLKIAIHIEATIPFRDENEQKLGRFDVLAKKMKGISKRYDIPLTNADVDETLLSAVRFANQDVAGFAHPDPAAFLDNTWKLLPETSIELRTDKVYSIRNYRRALQKIAAFFDWIEPKNIFHSYKHMPFEQDWQQMTTAARRNIGIAGNTWA
jgi:hypothetical protein